MFGLLIGIVTLSTFVDGYLRMRAECCEDEKTDKNKAEKIALGNMAESETVRIANLAFRSFFLTSYMVQLRRFHTHTAIFERFCYRCLI